MDVFALDLPPTRAMGLVTLSIMLALVVYEGLTGKYAAGRKIATDWQMLGLSVLGIALVERPVVLTAAERLSGHVTPERISTLGVLETDHPVLLVIAFIAVDELLHGLAHQLTHRPPPAHPVLAKVHAYYREAHRGHHQLGGADGRGEVSVTQSVVAGWGWLLGLPNYWFGAVVLSLGMVDTWFWGTFAKSVWGMHVHTNWQYDLYLLNHPNGLVRRTMFVLCHVLTFPNQHHQHHSRSKNSARNMQNFLAIYDWLLWKTLVIETERPTTYGWKQSPKDQHALHRYLSRPLKTASRTRTLEARA